MTRNDGKNGSLKNILVLLWCILNGICFSLGLWVIPDVIIEGKSTINPTILIVVIVIGSPLGIKWFYDLKRTQRKIISLQRSANKAE
jgi:hypothetical protein